MESNIGLAASLIGLGLSAIALQVAAPKAAAVYSERYNSLEPLPLNNLPAPVINVLTLGQKGLYDDITNFVMLQNVTEQKGKQTADALEFYMHSMLKPRPKAESLYILSCFIMVEDYSRPEACQSLIQAGMEVFPQSWRLPVIQGWVFVKYMKQPAQGARFYDFAAKQPNVPPHIANLSAKLLSDTELSDEDIAKSLEIVFANDSRSSFAKLLQSLRNKEAGGDK